MKILIITILLLSAIWCKAQTNSQRIAALEKQQTVFKADIAYLRKGKTADSIRIKILQDSINKFKPTWFNPNVFLLRSGSKVDSVNIKQ